MKNVLTHKGYSARIELDADDQIFFGRIADIDDGVGFHGESVPELVAAFHEAVNDYLETCAKIGKSPEKPYSGKLMLRVAPAVHAVAVKAARLSGKSLNQYSEEVLKERSEALVAAGAR